MAPVKSPATATATAMATATDYGLRLLLGCSPEHDLLLTASRAAESRLVLIYFLLYNLWVKVKQPTHHTPYTIHQSQQRMPGSSDRTLGTCNSLDWTREPEYPRRWEAAFQGVMFRHFARRRRKDRIGTATVRQRVFQMRKIPKRFAKCRREKEWVQGHANSHVPCPRLCPPNRTRSFRQIVMDACLTFSKEQSSRGFAVLKSGKRDGQGNGIRSPVLACRPISGWERLLFQLPPPYAKFRQHLAVRRCVMRLVRFPGRPCKESGIYRFLPYHYSLCCLLCGAFVVLIARIVAGNPTHTQLLLHSTEDGGTPFCKGTATFPLPLPPTPNDKLCPRSWTVIAVRLV